MPVHVKRPRIDVVISSPYHRCVQTAAAIIEALPERNGKKVGLTADLACDASQDL